MREAKMILPASPTSPQRPVRSIGVVALAALVMTLLVSCGGRQHSIEPGLWQLRMEGEVIDLTRDMTTGKMPPRDRKVNVVLNWRVNERAQRDEETVEIYYADQDAEERVDADPITGVIEVRDDKDPVLVVQSKTRRSKDDRTYEFELRGRIFNRRYIEGRLYAVRVDDKFGIAGPFTLKKLSAAAGSDGGPPSS